MGSQGGEGRSQLLGAQLAREKVQIGCGDVIRKLQKSMEPKTKFWSLNSDFSSLCSVTLAVGTRQSSNTRQQKLPGCPSLMWLPWTLVAETRNSALRLDQSASCKPKRKPDSLKNKIKNSQKRRKFHMDLNLCLFLSIISKTIFVSVKENTKKALNQKNKNKWLFKNN